MANPQDNWQHCKKPPRIHRSARARRASPAAEATAKNSISTGRPQFAVTHGKNTPRVRAPISDRTNWCSWRAKYRPRRICSRPPDYARTIYRSPSAKPKPYDQARRGAVFSAPTKDSQRRRGAAHERRSRRRPTSPAAPVKSTLAATNAMMDNLNRATKQFAELSEASIKAATRACSNMGAARNKLAPPTTKAPANYQAGGFFWLRQFAPLQTFPRRRGSFSGVVIPEAGPLLRSSEGLLHVLATVMAMLRQ